MISLYQLTILHIAASGGHNHIAEYLVVEKQADINTKDDNEVSIVM